MLSCISQNNFPLSLSPSLPPSLTISLSLSLSLPLSDGSAAQLCSRLLFEVSRSHTVRHSTLGRVPLDERSARRRDLYLHNTQQSQVIYIHAPGGIRTRVPCWLTAVGQRLTPRGSRDQLGKKIA